MCQLLGMNCNVPTDICFSFEGFARRGGETDEHKDGWGIAFFEGKGCRTFMDVQPSADSVVSDLVKHYPIHSMNVIAHIRKASVGAVRLENTHPFKRELWGEYWVFAHNGDLFDYEPVLNGCFQPVGTTDSERAFCALLQHLRERFAERPSIEALCEAIRDKAGQIAQLGTFNFLLSNGEILIAHCSTDLHYLIRQHPFDKAELKDLDVSVDFKQVTTPQDRVAVIATEPLTANETWTRIEPGQCMIFRNGAVVECFKN
ncbi:class II glutamine amidotransferase [Sedimenticola sp.]|uniref:class II glutamine amidotransferase n=1 Tax=Sedimenticola sp. TaxID=1940285 RepID=UPI003D1035B4